jgi:hypothetical protein
MPLNIFVGDIIAAGLWSIGLLSNRHTRLLRSTPRLSIVAFETSAHYILPDVPPTPMAGAHMVQAKLPGLHSTILTGILISPEHLTAG